MSPRDQGVLDQASTKRILSNVINNAAEAVPVNAKGLISLEAWADDAAVFVQIRDTGIGIDEKIVPHLFKKGISFFKSGGSGLGLSHAREILERYGGAISINSLHGAGTTVLIRIPRLKNEETSHSNGAGASLNL